MLLSINSRLISVFALASVALFPLFAEAQQAKPGEWPQWRGPNRDGLSQETGLLKKWPESGPQKVWEVDHVGVGYASLVIKDGRIFTQGDLEGVEHVICVSAKDGAVLWAKQPGPVAKQLTEKIVQEMKRLDQNKDNIVNEAEALNGLGWDFNKSDKPGTGTAAEIAAARVQKLFNKLDANTDGKLSFTETGSKFRDNYASIDTTDKTADAVTLAKSRATELIAALDKNQDGKLNKKEAQNSAIDRPFDRADAKQPGTDKGDQELSVEEIEAYLAKFEAGCDGLLSANELSAYYARVFPQRDGELTEVELRHHLGGYRNGQGDGPRGTPTLDGDRVFAEGGNGDLTCMDAATGETVWHKSLVNDLKGGKPGWGYSESPLIEGGLLIVTPGGKDGTVVALDKLSGNVVWRSEGSKEGAHYSSPVVAEIAGVRQIVQFARDSVFGLTATSGELLWNYRAANNGTANVCTPIVARGHVFASSSYGTGGGLVKISAGEGQKQKADEVYFDKAMANHHGGIVLVGDHMYGFGNGGLICMNFLTGEPAWKDRSVGKGSLLFADGMLYCLGESHQMALVEATPEEYRERGRFKVDNLGRPSWAHPVVSQGRLYIRNQGRLTAYEIKAEKE